MVPVLVAVTLTWAASAAGSAAWTAAAIAVVLAAPIAAVVTVVPSMVAVKVSPMAGVPLIVWVWVDMTWIALGGLAAGLARKVSLPVPLVSVIFELIALPAASVIWIVLAPVAVTWMLG